MTAEPSQRLDLLRSAPLNSWVALSNDETRIVATGQSFGQVTQMSEDAGEDDPVILRTPSIWAPLFL